MRLGEFICVHISLNYQCSGMETGNETKASLTVAQFVHVRMRLVHKINR